MGKRDAVRRVLLVGAFVMMLAVIFAPDFCEDLPEWLRSLLGCSECSSGNCSGADYIPAKYEPGGGRGGRTLAQR